MTDPSIEELREQIRQSEAYGRALLSRRNTLQAAVISAQSAVTQAQQNSDSGHADSLSSVEYARAAAVQALTRLEAETRDIFARQERAQNELNAVSAIHFKKRRMIEDRIATLQNEQLRNEQARAAVHASLDEALHRAAQV